MNRYIQIDAGTSRCESMTILFCANPTYFQHLATAAVSVAQNNRTSALDIRVLTCDRDEDAELMLHKSLRTYDNVVLSLHHMCDERLEHFFVDGFMTKEAYLRLFAAEVLPRNIKRVIYLDCDIVVLDNIRGLWNADLDGKPLGAVPDYPRVPRLSAPERLASLGMPMGAIYVNSGVLVIDLERWRQGRLSERLLKFVTEKGAALYAHDQDAINVVLASEIRLLDCRWNLQARMYHTGRAFAPIEFEATREARRHPAVLHYTGSEKPWLFRSRIARKGDYIRYQRLTAWSSVEPTGLSALQRIEFRLDRVLSRLGVNYLQVLFKLGRVPTKVASLLSSLRQRSPRLFAFGAASIFRLGLLIVRSVQHDGAATFQSSRWSRKRDPLL